MACVHCSHCGKSVSNAVVVADTSAPGLVVRAWVECPECLEAEPVVHVGDRIRFSTALLDQIDEHPDQRSRLVKVDRIVHEPDGSTTLQLTMWRPH